MNIILYNDSLKYLNKSLEKLRNGHNINVPLINSINNQFLLGQGYLINTNITRVNQEQVRRVEQILIELINKLKQIKNKASVPVPPTSVPPTSVPPSSGFSSSGFSSSGFSSSGFSSSSPFGPSSSIPVATTSTTVPPPVTGSFTFRPGSAPSSSTTLDLNTCKNQLKAFLKGQKVMDNTENIVNPNGLSKIAYNRFVQIMGSVMSGFSQSQIDDCLNQLGVTIPR